MFYNPILNVLLKYEKHIGVIDKSNSSTVDKPKLANIPQKSYNCVMKLLLTSSGNTNKSIRPSSKFTLAFL